MNLKEKYKTNFKNYIGKLPINNSYKEYIYNERFINDNPEFYLYYPIFFSEVFDISNSELDRLSIAGYLYYQSTLLMDSLIDDNDKSKIGLITICQEETIKILSSIFPIDSIFWGFWNQRKDEYFYAVNFEKELKKSKEVSFYDYIKLADFKSAFGKVAIDSLFTLDKNKDIELQKSLLASHKYFSVAYQLNDDILDFEEDFKSNQFNWLIYKYVNNNDSKKYSAKELKKLLYIKENIKEVFKEAVYNLKKAENCVSGINVPVWKTHLYRMRIKFSSSIIEIDNYLKLLKIEIELSNTKIENKKIDNSIRLAIEYLKKKQNKNGAWEDYINQGGISNIWSTAFVSSKLSSSIKLKKIFTKNIEIALLYMTKNQIKNGLWGYNTTWIEDADTTNFVLISLFLNQKLDTESKLFNEWEKYKTNENLFTTYANKNYLLNSLADKSIKDVKGWTKSHLCVSSVAFYLLSISNKKSKTFYDLKHFFDDKSIEKIESYWWTDLIYTYYYLALAYNVLDEKKRLNELQKAIAKKISDEGYKDVYGVNMFYTGLALEILLLNNYKNYVTEIEQCISYILKNQFSDGSWQNSNSLKIPNPNDIISSIKLEVSTHGTNVRAKEFNRLFTTSSILKSLCLWNEVN